MMSPRKRDTLLAWLSILIGVGTLIGSVVGAKAWADSVYVPRRVYTTDRGLDSLNRRQDSVVLHRLDTRVGEIYCATVPPAKRAGCR